MIEKYKKDVKKILDESKKNKTDVVKEMVIYKKKQKNIYQTYEKEELINKILDLELEMLFIINLNEEMSNKHEEILKKMVTKEEVSFLMLNLDCVEYKDKNINIGTRKKNLTLLKSICNDLKNYGEYNPYRA